MICRDKRSGFVRERKVKARTLEMLEVLKVPRVVLWKWFEAHNGTFIVAAN